MNYAVSFFKTRVGDTKLKLIKCQRKVGSCLKRERAEYIPYHNNVPLQSVVGLCNYPAHSQTKLAEGALYGKCKTITSVKRFSRNADGTGMYKPGKLCRWNITV